MGGDGGGGGHGKKGRNGGRREEAGRGEGEILPLQLFLKVGTYVDDRDIVTALLCCC